MATVSGHGMCVSPNPEWLAFWERCDVKARAIAAHVCDDLGVDPGAPVVRRVRWWSRDGRQHPTIFDVVLSHVLTERGTWPG